MNFFVLLDKKGKCRGGYNFVPEEMFSGIKNDVFSSFARFQEVNCEISNYDDSFPPRKEIFVMTYL